MDLKVYWTSHNWNWSSSSNHSSEVCFIFSPIEVFVFFELWYIKIVWTALIEQEQNQCLCMLVYRYKNADIHLFYTSRLQFWNYRFTHSIKLNLECAYYHIEVQKIAYPVHIIPYDNHKRWRYCCESFEHWWMSLVISRHLQIAS